MNVKQLQVDVPHFNHLSIIHRVFSYLGYGRALNTLFLAYGNAMPNRGATVSRTPRIVICLSGENIMHVPQGDKIIEISLRPCDAVFVSSEAWNTPAHEKEHTFLTLDFTLDHIRYYCKDICPLETVSPSKFYFLRFPDQTPPNDESSGLTPVSTFARITYVIGHHFLTH